MQKSLTRLDTLHYRVCAEWLMYKQAIAEDKPFEEVKTIYLRIKDLQQEINETAAIIQGKVEEKHK